MNAPGLAAEGFLQPGKAFRPAQGLVALADQASVHAFHVTDAQTNHVAAVLPVMQQAGNALIGAQPCHLRPAGYHQRFKEYSGGQVLQRVGQQGLAAQISQQLVGTKTSALAAGQDHAADLHGDAPPSDGFRAQRTGDGRHCFASYCNIIQSGMQAGPLDGFFGTKTV